MLLPSLFQASESISGSVVPLAMFFSWLGIFEVAQMGREGHFENLGDISSHRTIQKSYSNFCFDQMTFSSHVRPLTNQEYPGVFLTNIHKHFLSCSTSPSIFTDEKMDKGSPRKWGKFLFFFCSFSVLFLFCSAYSVVLEHRCLYSIQCTTHTFAKGFSAHRNIVLFSGNFNFIVAFLCLLHKLL